MVSESRARFGRFVTERRRALNLTQDEVRAAGGPSDAAQTRAENGTGPEPSQRTLRRLDIGLNWAEGSAARTLLGGVPTPLEAEPDRASVRPRDATEFGPDSVAVPVEMIADLLTPHATLNSFRGRWADVTEEEFDRATDALNAAISRIIGVYVTDLLERNGGPGVPVPALIEFAFGHHLDEPVGDDPADAEERLYRRWLAGRPIDAGAALESRFRRRWQARRGADA
ncbi:helix-turn-helix domain-containing protein [Rhodococcus maanshanensis]|uniref:Helix-turn-helix domain-containing protein n=1 Tax=Rhodococcus maanshanensis TaxID=183556 RepID=A0A1H7RBK1_9NOCA|nr:helix-turn-helix domain-containing protein [Rhodococcus maanshanensis]SEL57284.1 Helix-turn-helix domain-containing protein [Rhodococcus maanshanensis]